MHTALTAFDFLVLAILVLSAGLGLWRGVIREVFALAAWVTALVLTFLFGAQAASAIPLAPTPVWFKLLLGHVAVFVLVFIALSVLGYLLTRITHAVGLGFIDRSLGMMFGALRGALIVVILVLLAGATTLPQAPWWRESATARPLEIVASLLREKLPSDLARYFRGRWGTAPVASLSSHASARFPCAA